MIDMADDAQDRGVTLVQITVRSYVTKIHQVRVLRSASEEIRNECREMLVTQFCSNLWRRYKVMTAQYDVRPSFMDWLDGKRVEDTYRWSGTEHGHQFAVRQKWASRALKEALRPELNPVGEVSLEWFMAALDQWINTRQSNEGIYVIAVTQTATTSRKYDNSISLMFEREYTGDEEPEE